MNINLGIKYTYSNMYPIFNYKYIIRLAYNLCNKYLYVVGNIIYYNLIIIMLIILRNKDIHNT